MHAFFFSKNEQKEEFVYNYSCVSMYCIAGMSIYVLLDTSTLIVKASCSVHTSTFSLVA